MYFSQIQRRNFPFLFLSKFLALQGPIFYQHIIYLSEYLLGTFFDTFLANKLGQINFSSRLLRWMCTVNCLV